MNCHNTAPNTLLRSNTMIHNISNIINKWKQGSIEKYEDTALCTLLKKHGSDKKDLVKYDGHNYSNLYFEIFNSIKHLQLNILELGMGTNNPNIPSTMGINGNPGASLFAWEQFFPSSNIFGADIDKDILFNRGRIKTFYCDQTDANSVNNLWDSINQQMNIIIEDGLHEYEANICFLENSLPNLASTGIYLAEDLPSNAPEGLSLLRENFMKKYNLQTFEVIQMNKSPLLVIQKNK